MSKISELSDGSSLQSTDSLIAVRSGGNVRVKVDGALTLTNVTATSLDISGDIDVDGTANLDAVDIDGSVNIASTLTSGTDVGINSEYAVLGDDTSSRQLKLTQYQTGGSYDNAGHKINAASGYGELALAVGGTNALTLNASQNATFAGNVDVEGSAGIYQRNSSGGSIVLDDTDTADASIPMVYLRNSAGQLTLGRANRNASTGMTTSSTDSLTISNAGNATFVGNVDVSGELDVTGEWSLDGISGNGFKSWDYGTVLDISNFDSGGWARAHKILTSDDTGSVAFGVHGEGTTLTKAYWAITGDGNSDIGYNDDHGIFMLKDGSVGIGIASPSHLLHVYGASGSITNMTVGNPDVALRMSAYGSSHAEIRVETNHDLLFKTNGNNEKMRIEAGGNVGIGTTSPSSLLDVAGTVTCTSLVETSDAALKMDVAPIKNALDTVSALRGVTYKDKKTGDKRLGFIAQDVAPVLPELVDDSGDFLALRYGNTVGLLVEAIKEQSAEIQVLTKRVEELED